MARQPKKSSTTSSKSATSTKSAKSAPKSSTSTKSTDLGLSDLRLRLNFLEKENEKLLKQIEKNRSELHNLNESIQEVGQKIAARSAPLMQKMLEIDNKIHELFAEILTGRKLGKKSRKDIESVYYSLQASGVISPRLSPTTETKNMFDEFEFDNVNTEDWGDPRDREERSRGFGKKEAPQPDRDELKKIRQLYLRLAETFHPDKVADEADREYCTEVMKEINEAYQSGDLAKLLAIEKQQELGEIINRDSADDVTRRCAKVEAENAFLKNQLTSLKQELRLTKKTDQGAMTTEFKRMQKYGIDPIEAALSEVEAQIGIIEQVQKFVSDFRDRRITIKDFLKGPAQIMQPQELSEEELLFDFLSRY
jgi:predicted  nucleic acid-binding Zn-ribbon protein